MDKTTIIIPVFNHAALTVQCLKTLAGQGIRDIVVVDDGSTDNTQEMLKGFGGLVTVVAHKENQGFAAACNSGVQAASGRYLVFLNNDTVPTPGWLKALEDYAEKHPRASVVGSKLLYPDGRVQHAGVVICQDRYPRHIYSGFPANHPAVSRARRFQVVTGACMLVRAQAFEEERGFDTAFRNGFEDVDFCLRLSTHGHEVHFCPESVVQHLESVSAGRFKHDSQNVALYRERWLDRVRADDLTYYIEDGLLNLSYEGQYPIGLTVSPLLATRADEPQHLETLLKQSRQQVAELARENTRLRLELGGIPQVSHELRYRRLRGRIRAVAGRCLPQGATVLVVSKGDSSLLELPGRVAWHFPQTARGAYLGHHPADSQEAIAELERLRRKGAEYLLIPETYSWWLEHYSGFREHLESHYVPVEVPGHACAIFRLGNTQGQTNRPAPASGTINSVRENQPEPGKVKEFEHSAAA